MPQHLTGVCRSQAVAVGASKPQLCALLLCPWHPVLVSSLQEHNSKSLEMFPLICWDCGSPEESICGIQGLVTNQKAARRHDACKAVAPAHLLIGNGDVLR